MDGGRESNHLQRDISGQKSHPHLYGCLALPERERAELSSFQLLYVCIACDAQLNESLSLQSSSLKFKQSFNYAHMPSYVLQLCYAMYYNEMLHGIFSVHASVVIH